MMSNILAIFVAKSWLNDLEDISQSKKMFFLKTWQLLIFYLIAESKYTKISLLGLILGLCPANERRRCKVTPSLIGWVQI